MNVSVLSSNDITCSPGQEKKKQHTKKKRKKKSPHIGCAEYFERWAELLNNSHSLLAWFSLKRSIVVLSLWICGFVSVPVSCVLKLLRLNCICEKMLLRGKQEFVAWLVFALCVCGFYLQYACCCMHLLCFCAVWREWAWSFEKGWGTFMLVVWGSWFHCTSLMCFCFVLFFYYFEEHKAL